MLYLLFGVSVGVAIFVMYRCTSVGERRPRRGAARDAEFVRSIAGALRIPLSEARQMLVEAEATTPTEIAPRLYLGNAASARNRAALRARGVTHVLNATASLPNSFERERAFAYCRAPVDDTLQADLRGHFDLAAAFIGAALRGGGGCLVHCQQGVSRSAALVIAYLMRAEGLDFDDAFARVRARRFIHPNENFVRQLRALDERLARARGGGGGGDDDGPPARARRRGGGPASPEAVNHARS